MPNHDYQPDQALNLLLEKVTEQLPELASRIRTVIDGGTLVEVEEPPVDGRRKPRIFQKSQAYSDQEALGVAIEILSAYFVELPACVEASFEDFESVAIGKTNQQTFFDAKQQDDLSISSVGEPKHIGIELLAETAKLNLEVEEILSLKPPNTEEIEEQRQNLRNLKGLIDFS